MTEEVNNSIPIAEPEPSSLRLVATLGLAGFFSGLVLVSAFLYTRPILEAHRARALQEAVFKVLPGCTSFQALELQDGRLTAPEEGDAADRGEANPQIYAGYNKKGKLIGFALSGEEPGYQDLIVAIFGYNPKKEEGHWAGGTGK